MMSAVAKSLFLFSLVLSVTALATPNVHRNSFQHRGVAARIAVPEAFDSAADAVSAGPAVTRSTTGRRKRANGRCRLASSSASIPSSTPVSVSSTPSSTSAPATSSAIVNVAPIPSISSSVEAVTSSSVKAAPTTTHTVSSSSVVHTTSSAKAVPTTTSKAPAPASTASGDSSNLPSFLVGTQTGQGTFYATGLGACGITNTDTDYIAAVSHLLFDVFPGYNGANPNDNPVCNKKVTATYQGKTVSVTITDRCVGCALTDLDFSPAAFNTLADPAVGRISGMTWVWDT